MKCVVCKLGEPRPGFTTVTLEREPLLCLILQSKRGGADGRFR